MKNEKKVIFYAPIGNLITGFKNGGAEAGCRKTIEVLQKEGYHIVLVEKPSKKNDSKIELLILALKQFSLWFRFIFLFIKEKNAVLHVAGFYLNQIGYEWLIIKTAYIFNIKSIYEIRNGGMIEAYREGNNTYKKLMLSTLKNSTAILCQGVEYVRFIKKNLNKNSVYYPNYILDRFAVNKIYTNQLNDNKVRLVYLGRVVPDKNVDFILDVCNYLKKDGLPFYLQIIGGYENDYFNLLKNRMKQFQLQENVDITFLGRLETDEIFKILKEQHFFIFPTKEKREGHSNSLTETMGCGIVPIVSNIGFNASIVNNPDLVINEFDPLLYANKIIEIWKNNQWEKLSNQMYNRVNLNFTEHVVKKSLLDVYSQFFKNN